jgi:regulator of cell morphogenesis and NO signaling
MDLRFETISNENFVTDIVMKDHRTSGVFRKYNINYCCSGKIPLQAACELYKVDIDVLKKELNDTMRVIQISSSIDFKNWSIDFLVDYLINVHHAYLVINLPEITDILERFIKGHSSKYPYLHELMKAFNQLYGELVPHLEQEEKVIFPYLKQIFHAYESREPYAGLLVRTLRKPIEAMIQQEQDDIEKYLYTFRKLTNNYMPPPGACITHKVALSKLKELDADLVQHTYLENEILFPKAIQVEKELKNI